jgi:tRNA pseudouridine55 synthase
MPVHNIYKPIGWSPLDVITQFKKENPEFCDSPMTYAGRLDPMAEGVLILLSGEDRYKKPEFQKMDKAYQATFLLGVESDTYDCLGLIQKGSTMPLVGREDVESFLLGTHNLPFPPYSSFKVNGKPLHYWAQEGKLNEIVVPEKEMKVLDIKNIEIYEKDIQAVKKDVVNRIRCVRGSFRQEEIIKLWEGFVIEGGAMQLVDCTLTVTSGTYIRALAHEMGKRFGCEGVLYFLNRVSVGRYVVKDSVQS